MKISTFQQLSSEDDLVNSWLALMRPSPLEKKKKSCSFSLNLNATENQLGAVETKGTPKFAVMTVDNPAP